MKAILGHFTRRPAIEKTYLTLTPPPPTLLLAVRPASRRRCLWQARYLTIPILGSRLATRRAKKGA